MFTQEIEKFIKVDHEQSWRSLRKTAKNILKEKGVEIKDIYNNSLHALLEEFPEEYFYDQESTTLYKIVK